MNKSKYEFGVREHAIETYEDIKRRWDNDKELRDWLPGKYSDICMKLKLLKEGKDFKVISKTEDQLKDIAYIGSKIIDINYNLENGGVDNKRFIPSNTYTYDEMNEMERVKDSREFILSRLANIEAESDKKGECK